MNKIALSAIFAIVVISLGAVGFAGLTMISSVLAQEDNETMTGNMTMDAANMTDTNMTNGTGNISGVEDPF
jgi:hypothetical protein